MARTSYFRQLVQPALPMGPTLRPPHPLLRRWQMGSQPAETSVAPVAEAERLSWDVGDSPSPSPPRALNSDAMSNRINRSAPLRTTPLQTAAPSDLPPALPATRRQVAERMQEPSGDSPSFSPRMGRVRNSLPAETGVSDIPASQKAAVPLPPAPSEASIRRAPERTSDLLSVRKTDALENTAVVLARTAVRTETTTAAPAILRPIPSFPPRPAETPRPPTLHIGEIEVQITPAPTAQPAAVPVARAPKPPVAATLARGFPLAFGLRQS